MLESHPLHSLGLLLLLHLGYEILLPLFLLALPLPYRLLITVHYRVARGFIRARLLQGAPHRRFVDDLRRLSRRLVKLREHLLLADTPQIFVDVLVQP